MIFYFLFSCTLFLSIFPRSFSFTEIILYDFYSFSSNESFHLNATADSPYVDLNLQITAGTGYVPLPKIYSDINLTDQVNYTFSSFEKRMTLTIKNHTSNDYYFSIECVSCFYVLAAVPDEPAIRNITLKTTNFERIKPHEKVSFAYYAVKGSTSGQTYYIRATNCKMTVTSKYSSQTGNPILISTSSSLTTNNSPVITIEAIEMYNSYDEYCDIFIYVSMPGWGELFYLTEGTRHQLSDSTGIGVMHQIVQFPFYITIENMKEYSVVIKCFGYELTTITRNTIRVTQNYDEYGCTLSGNFNVVITIHETPEYLGYYPTYFQVSSFMQLHFLSEETRMFYTTILNSKGKVMVNYLEGSGNIYIRIKDSNQKELDGRSFLGKIDLDSLKDPEQIINPNDINSLAIPYSLDESSYPCLLTRSCEMYITIDNLIKNENIFHMNSINLYVQEDNDIIPTHSMFEPIVGEFWSNDDSPQYFNVKISSKTHKIIIQYYDEPILIDIYVNIGKTISK